MLSMNIEDLIDDLGGCGRYQWLASSLLQLSRFILVFSMLAMTFNGQEPEFVCYSYEYNMSQATNETIKIPLSECRPNNVTCEEHYFYTDNMYTIVNEWDLVCDRKWIVAMITTIQMTGVLVGCFICGHLGDFIGRKPTYFLSLIIQIVFNFVAYFCPNWQLYAAIRFVLGVGTGFLLAIYFNLMTEFMPTRWRPRAIAVPSWIFIACVFALVIRLLKNWKYIHIVTAASGIPFLFTYGIIQESFRWLVTKRKYKTARKVVDRIATINHKGRPDISIILAEAEEEVKQRRKATKTYSVIDLFKTAKMTKRTIALCFMWFSVSYAYYGLTFGVQSLSGDLYLNIFLMNIISAPISVCMMFPVNKIGRKLSSVFSFILTGICGIIVGVIQYIDTPYRGTVTNVFALTSKAGISCAWYVLIVYTTELYPTVVRSIGFGLCSTAARIGGMLAPQIVFLNDAVPGLLYFLSAFVMITSGLLCFAFPETKGKPLIDTFEHGAKGTEVNEDETFSNDNEILA